MKRDLRGEVSSSMWSMLSLKRAVRHPSGDVEEAVGDFPGGSVVKNPPASAGDMGLIPGLGRSHMPQSN